ncbi:hypothetical protein LZF95_05595 [Algoriphagus sp. AGSA1]|uniref:hypothetical protein n=1 Tax=Algoriphagus sp. AGSA1 TaxID=2907213 RepID=UPI001F28D3D2|nr:hypothetical protein [Algoriphagus sp. AGSA1]MCE7054139.1 hypothetical protein [Algoriphagus sp. AGSA1]
MDLFEHQIDKTKNLLPKYGPVNYFGKLLSAKEADHYVDCLLNTIAWRNDEAIVVGKKIITKPKVAWYGEKPFINSRWLLPALIPILIFQSVPHGR